LIRAADCWDAYASFADPSALAGDARKFRRRAREYRQLLAVSLWPYSKTPYGERGDRTVAGVG